jgi:hypothetical protein
MSLLQHNVVCGLLPKPLPFRRLADEKSKSIEICSLVAMVCPAG